jgi:hypothetical protein
MMNWDATQEEFDLISGIADRAVKMAAKHGAERLKRDVLMDLTAAHRNAFTLDLKGLLEAGDGDFSHDVFGIMKYLNRRTGKLEDCFVPRYAAKEVSA